MIELKGDNTSLLTTKRQNKRAFYIFYDHLLKNVTWGFFQCGLHLVCVDVLGTPMLSTMADDCLDQLVRSRITFQEREAPTQDSR